MVRILFLLSFFWLTSCLDATIPDSATTPSEGVPVIDDSDVTIGAPPADSGSTPNFNLPSLENETDSYQVRVIEDSTGDTKVDWTTIEPGESLTGLSLNETKSYSAQIRILAADGNTSEAVSSESWIPGSDGCVGNKITNSPYASGDGSFSDPYQICTHVQLIAIAANTGDFNSSFKLSASVDLDGQAFDGIGSLANPFTGRFIGANYEIRNYLISKASGDNIGFFNSLSTAYINGIRFVSPAISAPNSSTAGIVSGYCEYSTIKNITATNVQLSGDSALGVLCGESWQVNAINLDFDGEIVGTGGIVGGIIGMPMRGRYFNIDSETDINSPLATEVGGLYGAEGDSNPDFQNVTVNANITGDTDVGGLVGANWDGASIYRSSYEGTVTGQTNVGGLVGAAYDSPFSIYSVNSNAVVNGNQNVAGYIGYHGYRTNLYDSIIQGSVNGTGASQANFGGFWGAVDYYGHIYRSIVDVSINADTNAVGGAAGNITYFSASYDIIDSVVIADITANSATNSIGYFRGVNSDTAIPAVNTHYWSGASCVNTNGGGPACNTDGNANPVATLSDFYNSANAPLSSWDFVNIWQENFGSLPTPVQEQSFAPSSVQTCESEAFQGINYDCSIVVSDSDANEIQMIELSDENSCRWLYAYEADNLLGAPSADDIGQCEVVFTITDGTNASSEVRFFIDVFGGMSMSPNQGTSSYIDLGQQDDAAGAKLSTYTFTNNEETTITGVSVTGLSGHFAFEGGGSFPGTSGTCDGDLDPGESCTWVLSYDPSVTGFHYIDLTINFTNSNGAQSYDQRFRGWGI